MESPGATVAASVAPAPASAADAEAKPEDAQKKENTISNLPLLFANGYPTSLEKITEQQLNKFIPFMVQCSLGNVQPSTPVEPTGTAPPPENEPAAPVTPPWWPDDLPYALSPVRPESVAPSEWIRKLKELVCICYEYHNNVFLLRFCTVLSKYEPECLRFINNYNSTTSLYDRFNNKLLVTFRNENMVSDICLHSTPLKPPVCLTSPSLLCHPLSSPFSSTTRSTTRIGSVCCPAAKPDLLR